MNRDGQTEKRNKDMRKNLYILVGIVYMSCDRIAED